MSPDPERTDVSAATMAARMLAAFTVSVSFAVLLPARPYLVERLMETAQPPS